MQVCFKFRKYLMQVIQINKFSVIVYCVTYKLLKTTEIYK